MASTAGSIEQVGTSPTAVPWYLYALAVGATSIIVGVLWDISWHSTIGRDTFWTPAHIAMYLGGILGGLSSGWLALKTTFAGTAAERARIGAGVGLPGAAGAGSPSGARSRCSPPRRSMTGGIMPTVSTWRCSARPHTVLAAGILGIILGSLLLSLAWQNNTSGPAEGRGQALFAYSAGVLVAMFAILVVEYSAPNQRHAVTLLSSKLWTVPSLPARGRARLEAALAGNHRGAGLHAGDAVPCSGSCRSFRPEPLLGPIYNRVTHMVPPAFPLLLVIPALAIDLLLRRATGWSDWALAAAVGVVFFAFFFAAQFLFSEFLLSPMARNWFFGGDRIWPYDARPGPWRYQFWNLSQDPLSLRGLGVALVLAFLSARLGLAWGSWMARVKR